MCGRPTGSNTSVADGYWYADGHNAAMRAQCSIGASFPRGPKANRTAPENSFPFRGRSHPQARRADSATIFSHDVHDRHHGHHARRANCRGGAIDSREVAGINAFMGGRETTQTKYVVQLPHSVACGAGLTVHVQSHSRLRPAFNSYLSWPPHRHSPVAL